MVVLLTNDHDSSFEWNNLRGNFNHRSLEEDYDTYRNDGHSMVYILRRIGHAVNYVFWTLLGRSKGQKCPVMDGPSRSPSAWLSFRVLYIGCLPTRPYYILNWTVALWSMESIYIMEDDRHHFRSKASSACFNYAHMSILW